MARLDVLRRRWVATAGRDMRASGNRAAYHRAYDAYYAALGIALGYQRNLAGYWEAPDGSLPGCNDMEETLAGKGGA